MLWTQVNTQVNTSVVLELPTVSLYMPILEAILERTSNNLEELTILQAGGRRFESCTAHHGREVRPGHMGYTMYRSHR